MPTPSYRDEPTPGIDGRWFCINRIVEWLFERLCSGPDAVCHLEEALGQGLLRSMIQSGCERRLVEPSEWVTVLQLVWRDTPEGWFVDVALCETGAFLAASCYIWKPDYDQLWGTAPTPDPAPAPAPAPDLDPAAKLTRHLGGREPEHAWEDVAGRVDKLTEKQKLPLRPGGALNIQRGIEAMQECFRTHEPEPHPTEGSIRRWINNHPDRVRGWWPDAN